MGTMSFREPQVETPDKYHRHRKKVLVFSLVRITSGFSASQSARFTLRHRQLFLILAETDVVSKLALGYEGGSYHGRIDK